MSEPAVGDLLSVAQAIAIIDAAEVSPRVVEVALQEAQGLRLAEQIVADRDYPPFDKSLMDGYAVRCGDMNSGSAVLRVTGEIAAGGEARPAVGPGEAVAIMTGAPLPGGADGIVSVEEVEKISPREIRVTRTPSPGRYIARRGSDCARGAAVLERGAVLEAAQLAVAASVGAASVRVFDRPRVGVLATGDELVGIDQQPGPSQIRNCNSIMLIALLRRLGCDVSDLGTAPDHPARIKEAIARGLQFDALFVTGGMSMGEHDYVPRVLRELGVDLRITKLRIKPGKPFVFGMKAMERPATAGKLRDEATKEPLATRNSQLATSPNACFVFGLPGNPVSSFVCTARLAARLIRRLAGGEAEGRWISATLQSPLPANGPREFYQPAVLDEDGCVRPLQWKGSADVYTLARANALLVREENAPPVLAGRVVRVMEI